MEATSCVLYYAIVDIIYLTKITSIHDTDNLYILYD